MPARKQPTPEDTVTARRILLDGLARDADIFDLLSELAPLHPRNNTFPARRSSASPPTRWAGAGPAELTRCPWQGLRERFLPECRFRGKQNKKLQFAVLAAAATHGGTEPDLLDEIVWWQTDDFWQYALFAAVAYVRAAASRAGVPVPRHARTWISALATQRHNHHSGRSEGGHSTVEPPIITAGRRAVITEATCRWQRGKPVSVSPCGGSAAAAAIRSRWLPVGLLAIKLSIVICL
jgi:hypothetical protein